MESIDPDNIVAMESIVTGHHRLGGRGQQTARTQAAGRVGCQRLSAAWTGCRRHLSQGWFERFFTRRNTKT
jgi:hypothetical protein